ncbi:hypothetical protein L3X38_041945 [Prunus dulcis]|uniref:Uncharacterized protein n=1 Tax=Prunus dulcis TaxID=3755 RepID=A0AAD4YKS0_PRUDU|nr:hypothetical protein L3X38_041945 [Prunus dulcis]
MTAVHGSEPTINQMLHWFLLKRCPYQVGFCYLQSAVGKMIESNPSSKKTRKPHWFYASSAWEFPEGAYPEQPRIQRQFRMPCQKDVSNPISLVNQVLALLSTERATDILLASEGLSSSIGMRPNRNDPSTQPRLIKLAKGTTSGSGGGSQPPLVGGWPHMSVERSQVASGAMAPARAAQKRRAEKASPRDIGKSDWSIGALGGWGAGAQSYQEAVRRMLKVEVVEGLFTEEMGYNGMTMSALEDQMKATILYPLSITPLSFAILSVRSLQAILKLYIAAQNVATHREFDRGKRDEQAVTTIELNMNIAEKAKVEEELEIFWGRLEAEMKKNAELLSSVNKLAMEKKAHGEELSKSLKDLDEANRKIEALTSEL